MRLTTAAGVLALLLSTSCTTAASHSDQPVASADVDRPMRIMPMGDSMTAVDATAMGYKGYLLDQLLAAGHEIDYVGSQTSSGPSALKDPHHEGHPGWQNDQFRTANWGGRTAGAYVAEYEPDIVVYHVGTNDVWSGVPPNKAGRRLAAVMAQIYEAEPDVDVVLCKIIPSDVGRDGAWKRYNRAVEDVAEELRSEDHSVTLADLSGVIDRADLGVDGVHLTDAGHRKVADALLPTVEDVVTRRGG